MQDDLGHVLLGDFCTDIVDCEHKTAPIVPAGIPSIRTTDIKGGRLNIESANRVSMETYREWTKRIEPIPGDLILAREAPVGEVGMVPPNQRVCLGQRTVLLRTDRTKLESRYLLYLLQTPDMRHEMLRNAEGSVVPHLNVADIRGLAIPSPPPLVRQRAIAAVLGALDDKIELNRRMNQTLEAMVQALFQSWFVDFDPVRAKMEGRDVGLPKQICDRFPDSLETSTLGEIPNGWRVGKVGDVAEHPRRGVQPGQINPSTPYIALEHMPRHCLALTDWGFANAIESNKFAFSCGEILFGKLRPYFHKVGIAPVDGVCSTDIVVVAPREEQWFGFVLGHLSSDAFVARASMGSTGTRMPRTSWSEMASYPVVIPDKAIAGAFTDQVRPIISRLLVSIYECRALTAVRDVLLPRLISGEVQVNIG